MSKNLVLLLNSSEEVINVISWKRAITLLFGGKAELPFNYQEYHRISTVKGYYDLPKALILKSYVKLPRTMANLSRRNVFLRDNYECQYCSSYLPEDDRTLDHVIPISRGGKHEWTNVVSCCSYCNSRKADNTPEEAKMPLLNKPYRPQKQDLTAHVERRYLESWNRWIKKPA